MSFDLGKAFTCHHPEMLRVAKRLTHGSGIEPEDLVQETFLLVVRKIDLYDPSCKFRPWLYRVMRNKAIDLRRRGQGRKDTVNDPRLLFLRMTNLTPVQIVESKHFRPLLRRYVNNLSAPKADALIAVYYEGLTYREAAEKLGIPMGTLKGRLHDAIKALREMFVSEKLDKPQNASAYTAIGE